MASVGSDQRTVFILCGLIPERVPDRYPVMKGNLFGVVEGYRAPGASWGSLRGGRCDNHAVSCKHGPLSTTTLLLWLLLLLVVTL